MLIHGHWYDPGGAMELPTIPLTVTYQLVLSSSLVEPTSLGRTLTSMRRMPATWLATISWRQCHFRLAKSTSPSVLPVGGSCPGAVSATRTLEIWLSATHSAKVLSCM